MSIGSHQSSRSGSVDWLSPPSWLKALGTFDMDPCASVNQPWPTATRMLTAGGLLTEWQGMVWMNPPYGPPKVIRPWMKRMAVHNNGVALIFARTETAIWFDYIWPCARAVLFVKGRPHFHYPVTGLKAPANCGGPVALIAYGLGATQRLEDCGIPGRYIYLNNLVRG
jgi:hypothetical protein